MSYNTEINKLG